MTERKKDLLFLAGLLLLLVLFFSKILFTDKIIRAPDIINEFYWGVLENWQTGLSKLLDFGQIKAGWSTEINSGTSTMGGNSSLHFLVWLKLIFRLVPPPASVAWFIVLHLFFGAAGLYCYCRTIGLSRSAAFFAGAVFALATENASLINAGHVMKIATISYAPWAFLCVERGFRTRRLIWFLATGFVLAFQFFNNHWQIAFYTCLSVGVYAVIRTGGILCSAEERRLFPAPRLLGMNLVVLSFFLSTVAISLLPLANWAKDTNRGAQSGANQGKGGLDREEAMSWSMPPEETAAFVVPGFFGFSRQEAGENPPNIHSYYWGRMVFTQTLSYMGLLPWLLLPLPLVFRRDRYTWLAVIGIVGGILFSMGKYTPFYNFLYDYFPGINRFRVPKMMMFIPVMGLGILSARGIDLLMEAETRATKAFRRYAAGLMAFSVALFVLFCVVQVGKGSLTQVFMETLAHPTRYEQGEYLVMQRWNNLMLETGIAAVLALLCSAAIILGGRLKRLHLLPLVLICLYMADVWRVDDKFMFLVNAPQNSRAAKTPVMKYILRDPHHIQYRTLPMDSSDPMKYASNGIPVMFTSNAVQQRRWQEFLDNFSLNSAMPDLLNVKYLILDAKQYAREKGQMANKYQPVFRSPDGLQVVLENRSVMPKAWLVPSVYVATAVQTFGILNHPAFDPHQTALVETPPPIPLEAQPGVSLPPPGTVNVEQYESERISIVGDVRKNALLVLGEKYFQGWLAFVDGKQTEIVPVDHILRGVYLTPGRHRVEFRFDPLPFKIGKCLTLGSFALFAAMLVREWLLQRRRVKSEW